MENEINWHHFVELAVDSSSEIKPSFFHSADPSFSLSKATLESKSLPHNGILDTEKIFEKIELRVSMARLTSNLVNASQIKWKKWKKDFEIGGIWTPDFH